MSAQASTAANHGYAPSSPGSPGNPDERLPVIDTHPAASGRPTVVLLHGFPDHAAMWQAQVDHLAARGYRVIAPDLPGYGRAPVLPRTADYRADRVVDRVLATLDAIDVGQFHLVGHDWGAALAWVLAGRHPARVLSLMPLSVGHPTAYGRAGWGQKIQGWYTLFFQLRGLAEWLLVGDGRLSLRQVFSSHPEMDDAMARMRQPGRMRAALGLYRANMWSVLFGRFPPVNCRTLGIWSERDQFLTADQMRDSGRFVDGPWHYEQWPGGHWIPLEQPDRLNARLDAWLDASRHGDGQAGQTPPGAPAQAV